jgi:preprotein translocase subunit SecA
MDKQRKFVYRERQEVLEGVNLRDKVLGMFETDLEPIVDAATAEDDKPVDVDSITEWFQRKFGAESEVPDIAAMPRKEIFDQCIQVIEERFEIRKEQFGEDFDQLCKLLLLDSIDSKWKDHLSAMEALKSGIGLRGYAQVDPKNEYKKEGYKKFGEFKLNIAQQVSDFFFRVEMRPQDMELQDNYGGAGSQAVAPPPPMDATEARAMIEAMRAAGQLPPEVAEALDNGAEVVVAPDGRIAIQQVAPPEQAPQDGEASGDPAGEQAAGDAAAGAAQTNSASPDAAAGSGDSASPTEEPQASQTATIPDEWRKTGRNEPCPCGSGKKFKKCHGRGI